MSGDGHLSIFSNALEKHCFAIYTQRQTRDFHLKVMIGLSEGRRTPRALKKRDKVSGRDVSIMTLITS